VFLVLSVFWNIISIPCRSVCVRSRVCPCVIAHDSVSESLATFCANGDEVRL